MNFPVILAQADETGGMFGGVIGLAIIVVMIASMWKVFEKAGHPGWAAIIPIYNIYILLKIIDRPAWWLVLFLVPMVNFAVSIIITLELAKAFGKDIGFGLVLTFLPFIGYPLLGFGDARYTGPSPLF